MPRRPRNSDPNEDEVEELLAPMSESGALKRKFDFTSALGVEKIARKVRKLSRKEEETWNKTSADIRTQCVKTIVRLFVLKGSKKEPILRSHLSAAIDPAHKKLLNPALLEASNQLRDVFGILLLPGNHFLLEGKGRKEEFMLISEREESSLRAIVAEVAVSSRAAFTGFSFAVFLCLWTAPGKRLTLEALLRKIRCVDRRFPETESRGRRGSSGYDGNGMGQELEASAGCNGFSGLLARLRAEGYVLLERSEAEGGGEQQPSQDRDTALAKQIFTLGPRFFAEVGVRRLLIAFHTIAGKELDNHTLRQLNQEEISKGNNADDSDEEEGLEVVGDD